LMTKTLGQSGLYRCRLTIEVEPGGSVD